MYSAKYVEKSTNAAQQSAMRSPAANPARRAIAEHTAAKTAPGAVRRSCTPHLARSAVHASTGSDREIQSVLPSSDTLGTAISFIEQTRHTAAVSSTGMAPSVSNTLSSVPAITPPRRSSKTPEMGSRSVPRPQFSI